MSNGKNRTLQPMLRKLSYLQPLGAEEEIALLSLPHEVKSLYRQDYIVRERERATHSCLMLSGYSFRHKIVASGARQICAVHMKGDLVDLQNSLLGSRITACRC